MFTSKYRWMAAFGTSIACHVVVFVVIGVVVALFPSAPIDKGPIQVDLVSLSGGGGGGGFLTAPGRFLLLPQQGKVIGQLGRQGGASGIRLRLGGDGVFSPQQGGGREADTAEGESDQQAELEGGGMKNRAHSAAYGQ